MILLNLFFAIVLGYWAKRDFERGFDNLGWINVFSVHSTPQLLPIIFYEIE